MYYKEKCSETNATSSGSSIQQEFCSHWKTGIAAATAAAKNPSKQAAVKKCKRLHFQPTTIVRDIIYFSQVYYLDKYHVNQKKVTRKS
jgi:hypothetical protein